MTQATLRPCPFCGAAAEFEYNDEADDGMGRVKCTNPKCAATSDYTDRDDATERWNRRQEKTG